MPSFIPLDVSALLPLSVVTRASSRSSEKAVRGCTVGTRAGVGKTSLELFLHITPLKGHDSQRITILWNKQQGSKVKRLLTKAVFQ